MAPSTLNGYGQLPVTQTTSDNPHPGGKQQDASNINAVRTQTPQVGLIAATGDGSQSAAKDVRTLEAPRFKQGDAGSVKEERLREYLQRLDEQRLVKQSGDISLRSLAELFIAFNTPARSGNLSASLFRLNSIAAKLDKEVLALLAKGSGAEAIREVLGQAGQEMQVDRLSGSDIEQLTLDITQLLRTPAERLTLGKLAVLQTGLAAIQDYDDKQCARLKELTSKLLETTSEDDELIASHAKTRDLRLRLISTLQSLGNSALATALQETAPKADQPQDQ